MYSYEGKDVRVLVGNDHEHSLDEAIALAPKMWPSYYVSRHTRGWVFVSALGRWYVFDDGRTGWIPLEPDEAMTLYNALGKKETEVLVELHEIPDPDDQQLIDAHKQMEQDWAEAGIYPAPDPAEDFLFFQRYVREEDL